MARRISIAILFLAALILAFWAGRNSSSLPGPSAQGVAARQSGASPFPRAAPGASRTEGRLGPLGVRVQVQVVQAKMGVLQAIRQVGGTVVPYLQVNVPAQVGGVVARILKNPGDQVTQGEAVVQLDTASLRLALANAMTTLENAQINLAAQTRAVQETRSRLEAQLRQAQAAYEAASKAYAAALRVHELGGLSDAELAQAQANLAQAQANLEAAKSALAQNERANEETLAALSVAVTQARNQLAQAELNLANATIRAPFSGEILSVPATPGGYLGMGATAFTLVQGRRIQFSVSPEEAAHLPPGSPVELLFGGQSLTARVDQNPGGPAGTSLVTLTARPQGNASLTLGASGTVRYKVTLAKGVLIPVTALTSDGAMVYVYAVEQGSAHKKIVQVIAQAGDQVAVTGLAPGMEVVLNPPPGLLDGSPVATGGFRQEGTSSTPGVTPGRPSNGGQGRGR